MNTHLRLSPAYFAIIVANLVPIYGAAVGKLIFFQVIYLYWFESLMLIFFSCIRIALARGTKMDGGLLLRRDETTLAKDSNSGFFFRLGLIVKYIIARVLILCFYLIFLVAFIAAQVTAKGHRHDILDTVIFRNSFFNASLILFLISMAVQLVAGFLMNGRYRVMSPYNYNSFLDTRLVILHVMIVGVVFIHQFLFEGTAYAANGEIVYVGLFMLVKSLVDVAMLKKEQREHGDELVMI